MSVPPPPPPPFRADHIGSLKRPAYLLQKRVNFDKKECTAEQLREVEDRAIQDIVQMQRDVGIKAITDGEFRRHMFFDGVFDNLEGMQYFPEVPEHKFMYYVPDVAAFKKLSFKNAASYMCEGKIKRTKPFYRDQFEYLKKIAEPEEIPHLKITMCAPEWFHLRHGPYAFNKEVYGTDEEYFADISAAYRAEIKELYSLGCRNIQFDDPLLAYFCAESMIEGMTKEGVDHEALLNLYCKVYNDCLEGKPSDMVAGLHLCRGNFKDGKHFSEGGYDRIAGKLFNDINVNCYYLEYDTERAGTFEPLKLLPSNKTVVLGVVSSKLSQLEDKAELRRRIEQAAETIADGNPKRSKEAALSQICISPQCGFASHSEGNPVSEEDVKRKLGLVAHVAKEIWSDA